MAGFPVALDSKHDIGTDHDYSQWSVTAVSQEKDKVL